MSTEHKQDRTLVRSDSFKKVNEVFHKQVYDIKLKDFIVTNLKDLFVENLPSETVKELPSRYLYSIGLFLYIVWIIIFVEFFLETYNSEISTSFISLQSDAGVCSKISLPMSGTYKLDANNRWDIMKGFDISRAIFEIDLKYYIAPATGDPSAPLIRDIAPTQDIFNKLGSYNLAYTLIFAMTFRKHIGEGLLQSVQTTGQATIVFKLNPFSFVAYSTVYGICENKGQMYYMSPKLSNTWIAYDLATSATCSRSLSTPTPYNVSTKAPIPNDFFKKNIIMSIDVNTFTLTMSLNLEYTPLNDLYYVNRNKSFHMSHNGVLYLFSKHSDDRYAMDNLLCVQNQTAIPPGIVGVRILCFMTIYSYLAVPTYNHMGANLFEAEYCDCTKPSIGNSKDCNKFNMMSGIVYYKRDDIFPNIKTDVSRLIELVGKYDSYADFNRDAYLASFYTYDASITAHNQSAYKSAFDFCTITDPNNNTNTISCIVHTVFNVANPIDPNYAINYNEFLVENGSCNVLYSVSEFTMPPLNFYQPYYECYPTVQDTVINSLGVSTGNTSLFMALFVLFMIPVLYKFLDVFNQLPTKEKYKNTDKKKAIDNLAKILLKIQDGDREGIHPDGTLMNLSKELLRINEMEEIELDTQLYSLQKDNMNEKDFNKFRKQLTCSVDDPQDVFDQLALSKFGVFDELASSTAYTLNNNTAFEEDKIHIHLKCDDIYIDNKLQGSIENVSVRIILENALKIEDFKKLSSSNIKVLNLPKKLSETNVLMRHIVDVELLLFEIKIYFKKYIQATTTNNNINTTSNNTTNTVSNDQNQQQRSQIDSVVFDHLYDFQCGEILSIQLNNVSLNSIFEKDHDRIFLLMASTLVMHASILFKKEIKDIINKQSEQVAYNIGGKILTYSNLISLTHIKY